MAPSQPPTWSYQNICDEQPAAADARIAQKPACAGVLSQNIDMMNLAGFCRNCLSRWYQEAANDRGIDMTKDEAREIFYGMPYDEWRDQFQTEATAETQKAFEKSFAENVGTKV